MKTKTISVALLLLIGAGSARAYTIENVKWNPGIVPFYLDLGQYNATAAKELNTWDQYTGNTYLRTTNNSSVNGSPWFMDGRNSVVWSDSIGYDLPGNILGVCSFDTRDGNGNFTSVLHEADVVINSDFDWTYYDIGWVLLHEIGHGIGLGHSQYSSAVMYAYYWGNPAELTADDIAGAQFIYGPRTGQGPTVPDSGTTLGLMAVGVASIITFRRQNRHN